MVTLKSSEVTAGRGCISIPALLETVNCPGLNVVSSSQLPEFSWGHRDYTTLFLSKPMDEWDLLLSEDSVEEVILPVLQWLEQRRELVWRSG